MRKIIAYLTYYYKLHILKDKFVKAHRKWVKCDGDNSLRIDYLLTDQSLVFDIGGFKGDFADIIFKKYQSNIFIFEPVEGFYKTIHKRFISNKKVNVFNFGLSSEDRIQDITLIGNSSSVYQKGENLEKINLKSISNFINEYKVEKIDLMKINIEGGEFDLLDDLIEKDLVKNIDNIQIQFHDFFEDAYLRRDKIRSQLSKTHQLTYDFFFVWENWKLI